MNDKLPFDEREWLLQERALREERLASADSGDAGAASYRIVVRALREPVREALPADFAARIAARCARPNARGDNGLEAWLVRVLVVVFAVSALYVVASQGGAWLRASLSLLPAADATAVRSWGLALGACMAMTWMLGRLRDVSGHATG